MLPDARGTKLVQNWMPGDSVSFSEGWVFNNVYEQSELRVVVFVQDNLTKEVLQSALLDFSSITDATGVDDNNLNEFNFKLYPNPTSSKVYVLFGNPMKDESEIIVINQLGEIVDEIKVNKGVNKLSIVTNHYPNGIYYLKMIDSNNNIITKKLSVIH